MPKTLVSSSPIEMYTIAMLMRKIGLTERVIGMLRIIGQNFKPEQK